MPILAPGQMTSYGVPDNAIDMSPAFFNIKQPNTPLFNILGVGKPAKDKTVHWYDDVRLPTSTTLAANYTAADGQMTLTESAFFRVGTVLRCGATVARVTAVNNTTDVVTITVLANDANRASGLTVEIVGNGQVEGKAFANTATTTRTERTNVTQIFDETAEVSGTEESIVAVNGITGRMAEEVARKLEYLYLQIARSIWSGVKLAPSTNADPRLMDGIKNFIATNGYNPTGATFTQANIDAFLLELRNAGAPLTEIWCNPVVARQFSGLMADKVVVERADGVVGQYVRSYLSGLGDQLTINADPGCPDTDAFYVFPSSALALRPLRAVQAQEMAKVGDAYRKLIVGEYSLEFRNSQIYGKYTISAGT